MCGIVGIYELDADPLANQADVKKMSASILHRGPDGDGFLFKKHVALGHRRLSIIDVAGGDQPIFNEDQTVSIVFNGEIYNYKELYQELLGYGHEFCTASDTETIVHLYEQFGIESLDKLNGMFTFAIWDESRERLLIARDRMGEKPLYYYQAGKRLVFGSELKTLLTQPDCPRELDQDVLDMYLAYGYVPEPYCIFRGIRKLPAAHYLVAEKGQVSITRYWSIPRVEATHPGNFQDQLQEFSERINETVKLRLRSDVPVGAFLSGGIDSSLMVSVAAEQLPGLSTFSVGFSEEDFDELGYAAKIAERYGTTHHEIQIEDLDADLFPRIVNHFDEPFSDSSAIPTYYVTREAARHVKVCISGDAGDELFAGYHRYMPEALEAQMDKLPLSLRAGFLGTFANMLPDSFVGKGKMRRLSADGEIRWQRKLGVFDEAERQQLYAPSMRNHFDQQAKLFKPYFNQGLDELSSRMWADQHTYLPDDILVKVDRTSMWHSLEVRVPFLDHTLVEFANSLPSDSKINGGVQKYLLKEFLKTRVPKDLLERPKTGFSLPIRHWLSGDMGEFAGDMLNKDARAAEFLNPDYMQGLVRQHREGSRDLSKRIWSLLWLEQWLRNIHVTGAEVNNAA